MFAGRMSFVRSDSPLEVTPWQEICTGVLGANITRFGKVLRQ
jgi:hypothetical protein